MPFPLKPTNLSKVLFTKDLYMNLKGVRATFYTSENFRISNLEKRLPLHLFIYVLNFYKNLFEPKLPTVSRK